MHACIHAIWSMIGRRKCKRRAETSPAKSTVGRLAGKKSRWNKDGTKGLAGKSGYEARKLVPPADLRQAQSPRAGCGGHDLGGPMARAREREGEITLAANLMTSLPRSPCEVEPHGCFVGSDVCLSELRLCGCGWRAVRAGWFVWRVTYGPMSYNTRKCLV